MRNKIASFTLPLFICLVSAFLVSNRSGVAHSQEKLGPQIDWEKTVEAARKEKQITVYIAEWGAVLDTGVFERAYPGIKVVGVNLGNSNLVAQRIMSERRANKYLADVTIVGSSQMLDFYRNKLLQPVRPVLSLPDVLDESRWWQGKHHYVDREGEYMFRYVYVPNWGSVSYNTHLVNPKEFRSLWDFLDPRWRGKIEVFDPQAGGPANAAMRLFYHHSELGPPFIKRLLGQTNTTLFRDRRQGVDWLGTGKFALCFFCDTNELTRARRNGLAVAKFGPMKEGGALTSRQGILGIMADAPHANAAKVFINWYLSREGQSTLLRATATGGAPDSLRIDIPKDDVIQEDRRIEGVPYLELDVPGLMEMEPILKLVKETMARGDKN